MKMHLVFNMPQCIIQILVAILFLFALPGTRQANCLEAPSRLLYCQFVETENVDTVDYRSLGAFATRNRWLSRKGSLRTKGEECILHLASDLIEPEG